MELNIPCKHCKSKMEKNVQILDGNIGPLGIVSVTCNECGAIGAVECSLDLAAEFIQDPKKKVSKELLMAFLSAASQAEVS